MSTPVTRATVGCGAALALAILAPTAPARAGGFYLLDRGVRPMGRGGAFVAGADDPGALWYDPAGLGFAGEQLLLDATLTFLSIDFTRIDGGGNVQPTVHGSNAPIPVPTLAGSFDFGLEHFTFGVGLFAPNAALLLYPESFTVDGAPYPAPQRYSLLSMEGSAVASVALGAAWTPLPRELSLGLALHLVTGSFASRVALSACDGAICTFPEDPDYDAVAQLTLAPIFTASALFGVSWQPGPIRIGASVSTPFSLSGNAAIQVRPPAAAVFDGAFLRNRAGRCADVDDARIARAMAEGSTEYDDCLATSAHVNLDFPIVVRFGVELLAVQNLRLEASVVWETWSLQREVAIRPNDVWIADALGGSLDYELGPIGIPRNMRDTVSVRLGGEHTVDGWMQIRAGAYWENGAFDDPWLSPLTIDSDKIVVALGAGVRLDEGVWIDALVGYAHLFARSVRNSRVPQPNPIRPPLEDPDPGRREPGDPVYVGNGDYSFTAPFLGLGLRWQADAPPRATSLPPAPAETEPTSPTNEETSDENDAVPIDPARPWYQQGTAGGMPAPSTERSAAEPSAAEPSAAEPPPEAIEPEQAPAERHRTGRRGRPGRRPRADR